MKDIELKLFVITTPCSLGGNSSRVTAVMTRTCPITTRVFKNKNHALFCAKIKNLIKFVCHSSGVWLQNIFHTFVQNWLLDKIFCLDYVLLLCVCVLTRQRSLKLIKASVLQECANISNLELPK